ncbi:MAG: hypothetical protein IJD24_00410, partial [Agathobacter sp.]|nr:hypothetical protein [Agathobacter sp.]
MGSAFLILGILLVIIIFLNAMAKVAVRPKVHTLQYELDKLVTYDYMKDESIDIINEHKVKSFDGYELWTG